MAAPNTTEAIVPTAQAPTTSRAEATEDIGSTQTPPKESEAALIKGIQSIKVATVPGPRQDGPGDRQSTQNIRCSCEDQDVSPQDPPILLA